VKINYQWIAESLLAGRGVSFTVDEIAQKAATIDFSSVEESHFWRYESYLLRHAKEWDTLLIEEKIILVIDAMIAEIRSHG
jgi:hypothetical protein